MRPDHVKGFPAVHFKGYCASEALASAHCSLNTSKDFVASVPQAWNTTNSIASTMRPCMAPMCHKMPRFGCLLHIRLQAYVLRIDRQASELRNKTEQHSTSLPFLDDFLSTKEGEPS